MRSDRNGTDSGGPRRPSRTTSAVLAVVLALGLVVAMPGVGFAERQRVRAAAERWRPAHLFITVGDTVVWRNPDDRRHNVVAYGGGWRFNKTLDPGESVRRVFDEVRTGGDPYQYRCTLHSSLVNGRCRGMCGLIHVFTA
jgi:plastocyanin